MNYSSSSFVISNLRFNFSLSFILQNFRNIIRKYWYFGKCSLLHASCGHLLFHVCIFPYQRISQPLHLVFICNCNLNPLSLCSIFKFSFLFMLHTAFQFHFGIPVSTWRVAQNPGYTQEQQSLLCSPYFYF